MATHVLIVEGDAALSAGMRGALERHGFSVQETQDGRTCLEVARQAQPACVILAVDLPAGQNGYILCGKFKKDEDLRTLPVVIVGSSEGFAQHGKLKNRADAYLAKPLQLDAFVDRIAELTGHTASPAPADAPAAVSAAAVHDLDAEDATVSGDPDLDLIDAAFDTAPVFKRPPPPAADPAFSSLDALGGEETGMPGAGPAGLEAPDREALAPDREALAPASHDTEHAAFDLGGLTPVPSGDAPEHVPDEAAPPPTAGDVTEADIDALGLTPAGEAPEMLRREVSRLQAALEDAQARSFSSDVRIHQLEAELAGRAAVDEEPGGDRAGRDQVLRRDRDIVRLKTELHAKEQELSDLRDQSMRLEQQTLELTGEVSRRDAQIKTLQSRSEQERRRLEQALERAELAAREAHEQASEAQAAVEAASARADAAEQEAGDLRTHAQKAEGERDQAEGELATARRDCELNRAHADGAQRQLATLQATLEQSQSDLAATREQLSLRDAARNEELGTYQTRVRELEAVARKHEERVTRLYARLKSEEKAREKAARAVAMAGQLLSQSSPGAPAEKTGAGDDEPAAATR